MNTTTTLYTLLVSAERSAMHDRPLILTAEDAQILHRLLVALSAIASGGAVSDALQSVNDVTFVTMP